MTIQNKNNQSGVKFSVWIQWHKEELLVLQSTWMKYSHKLQQCLEWVFKRGTMSTWGHTSLVVEGCPVHTGHSRHSQSLGMRLQKHHSLLGRCLKLYFPLKISLFLTALLKIQLNEYLYKLQLKLTPLNIYYIQNEIFSLFIKFFQQSCSLWQKF
jgi:hypothetical protein